MGSCPAGLWYHRPTGIRRVEVLSLDDPSGGKTMDANFPVVWHRIIGTTLRQRARSETCLFMYHHASMARKSNSMPESIGLAPDQNFLALSSSPPSTPHPSLPCSEHMAWWWWWWWHLAALIPASCALSSAVGMLGTATSSTTCGSSQVQRGAMNYLVLQLQTWLLSKKCSSVGSTRQTRVMHTDAHAEGKGDKDTF